MHSEAAMSQGKAVSISGKVFEEDSHQGDLLFNSKEIFQMTIFVVTRLFQDGGLYRPRTYTLGEADVRPPSTDLKQERDALIQSLAINKESADFNIGMRIAVIIEADNEQDAISLAEEKFSVPVDLLRTVNAGLSRVSLMRSGCVLNLSTGQTIPISPKRFSPFTSFVTDSNPYPTIDMQQWILNANTELTSRYLRSIHWSGNANHEPNPQLRILFRWFAVEAMWKENEADNMAPILLWALGFPNGRNAGSVSSSVMSELRKHLTYSTWHKKIERDLDEIRTFRNKSAHEGFRAFDFSRQSLKRFNVIMTLGCSRSQGLGWRAIQEGIKTLSDAKESLPLLFEYRENLKNDILGTIIYMLENPSNSADE
jgi:hypothetical protein